MKKIKRTLKNTTEKVKNIRSDDSTPANSAPPRITNNTVAEHREEVLSTARKYIYPLQHSRHRIVIVSVSIFMAALIAFFTYTIFALYKSQSTSTFVYRITQVLPFPVAKAGPDFVAYENYLFELRRYIHYYSTQQDVDFSSKSGKEQLESYKKQALDGVIQDAYVKQLAEDHKITVSGQEVSDQIALLKAQNRLGGSDQVFRDVLREFWNWDERDFRRELQSQLLAQKVVSKLDTQAHEEAETVLAQLNSGADFAALAAQYSDDQATKSSGGDYGIDIERTTREIPAPVLTQILTLQPNQVSGVIETPTGLEIVKVLQDNNGKIRAAHIVISFKPISTFIEPLEKENGSSRYISI